MGLSMTGGPCSGRCHGQEVVFQLLFGFRGRVPRQLVRHLGRHSGLQEHLPPILHLGPRRRLLADHRGLGTGGPALGAGAIDGLAVLDVLQNPPDPGQGDAVSLGLLVQLGQGFGRGPEIGQGQAHGGDQAVRQGKMLPQGPVIRGLADILGILGRGGGETGAAAVA